MVTADQSVLILSVFRVSFWRDIL